MTTVERLAENYARFLGFLERRVGSREVAEDILQDAFVRGVERAQDLRDEESATAWFYRVLRNAIADHYRRRDVENRAHDRMAVLSETSDPPMDEDELWREVCTCVDDMIDTLKPEYAHVLRRVDLEGLGIKDYAEVEQITANNASVRLHRARGALKRQVERSCGACAVHRCFDCTCRNSGSLNGVGVGSLDRG